MEGFCEIELGNSGDGSQDRVCRSLIMTQSGYAYISKSVQVPRMVFPRVMARKVGGIDICYGLGIDSHNLPQISTTAPSIVKQNEDGPFFYISRQKSRGAREVLVA